MNPHLNMESLYCRQGHCGSARSWKHGSSPCTANWGAEGNRDGRASLPWELKPKGRLPSSTVAGKSDDTQLSGSPFL